VNRRQKELFYFSLFRVCALTVAGFLVILVGYILINGIGAINWAFLTEYPRKNNTAGGIFPAILGTLYLMALVTLIAVPLGVFTAVYVTEYQRDSWWKSLLRIVIHNLAGVPSIVYGLLGLGLFVFALGMGFGLLASALTLSLLVLPLIITASREALHAVPQSLREASFALGATKWQTVRHHVLPYAMPGVLTGIILSVSRAAGETAPILLTGVVYTMVGPPRLDAFMALPYHLFTIATQTANAPQQVQYGTALVLLIMVVGINLGAIIMRNRYREKYKW